MTLKWYVALCTRVLPRLFKLSPWVDLDLFYAKVKFDYIGFCMGESENYVLFGNYCSHRPQSWFQYSNKWVNEVQWVSKVKVIIWPWPKVTQISKLNLLFLKLLSHLEPNFIWKLMGTWEWKFVQMSRVTWPRCPPCPYMVKTLKNLLQNQ